MHVRIGMYVYKRGAHGITDLTLFEEKRSSLPVFIFRWYWSGAAAFRLMLGAISSQFKLTHNCGSCCRGLPRMENHPTERGAGVIPKDKSF